MQDSEREFADFLESQGKTYKPQPKTFRFDGTSYRPDFYCFEDDIYYEVKTSFPTGEAIRLLKFKKSFPYIKLKIVSPNGYPYYSCSSGKRFEIIEGKLNILKSRDILEISLDEFQENMSDFHIIEKKERGNNIKCFRSNMPMMKQIDEAKKQLGISK